LIDPNLEKFGESLADGAAYATKILARMARLALVAKPPRVVSVDHAAPPDDLFPPGDRFQAGIVPLSGDMFGQAMLVFPDAAADELARSLSMATNVNAPPGAALEEATNIFSNTALASITRDFKLSVYPAPPRLVRGRASAAWSAFFQPLDQPEPRSTVAVVEIVSPDRRLVGHFLLALRRDSLDNVRWKSVGMSDKRIDVKMGDLRSAAAPGILKVTSLGSCLAVILFDPVSKLGAVAHVMLPNCTSPELGRARPGKYADTAIEALLKNFPGAPASRLRVWMIGGASMFALEGSAALQIGQRNVEVAKKRLAAAGIVHFAEETGGSMGRTVELDTRAGEVSIHSAAGVKRLIPHKTPAARALPPPPPPAKKP
jgi:chemotaxis protein CheD